MGVVDADPARVLRASGFQLGDRPLHDHAAVIDDRDRVADLLDLVEQVRREHDCPALVDEPPNHHPELLDAGRVEAVRRLVEDQQLGVAEEGAGDTQPLAHTERVGLDAIVGAVEKADAIEGALDPAVRGRFARRGHDPEVLAPGEEAVEARLLDDGADPRECLRALAPGRVSRAAACCRRRRG